MVWRVLELVGEGISMGMTAIGFYFLGFRFILMEVVGMSPLSRMPGEALSFSLVLLKDC